MVRNFGLNRVLEPKGVVPVAAWKVDNSREVRSREARVNLECIHLEWDNFQQICNSCGFDEEKIKAKIIDIVEKRGKLHNPFTGTGGVLIGTVDEIAGDSKGHTSLKPGDRIYCITSLCGLPIYIEDIESIDYNYGQINCRGYAIIFQASPVYILEKELKPNYTLAAIDEAASIYSAYNLAIDNKCKKVIIIGRTVYTSILYAAALRQALGDESNIVSIMDDGSHSSLTNKEKSQLMAPFINESYYVDLTEPTLVYEQIAGEIFETGPADLVIVGEAIFGAETLGVMLTKPYGGLFFTSVDNHYSTAAMAAETMGKELTMYVFDQYNEEYPDFTIQLIKNIKPTLEEINELFDKKKSKTKATKSMAKSIMLSNAGKEDDFVYQSPVTKAMVEDVMNIAKYDCNVIIQGETGVGKEKVLSLIHQNSERHGQPCVKINCATIQENLAESEFFGYEGGAFTGAQASGKPGYFEMANNGILFLDEIGTLSMNMRSKLLRVLQENQFYRVGGTKQISVNVRVIVANNVPLKQLVDEGKFREDLYYRLNICTVEVPPLRARKEDIICLAEAFTANWTKQYKVEKALSPEALNALYEYYWPGNVRELENIVHRLVISSKGTVITGEDAEELLNESAYGDMMVSVRKRFNRDETLDFHHLMEQQEKQIIEYALKKEGTTRKAAELLGLPQTTFARKKVKYGL